MFMLMPTFIYVALKKLHKNRKPRIIKKQFLILIQFLIIPRLLSDFIQYYPFNIFPGYFTSSYSIIGISTMVLTIALYYCAQNNWACDFSISKTMCKNIIGLILWMDLKIPLKNCKGHQY